MATEKVGSYISVQAVTLPGRLNIIRKGKRPKDFQPKHSCTGLSVDR